MTKIFLSYARTDNKVADDGAPGWVSYFDKALKIELEQWGLPEDVVWRDIREIEGNEQFRKEISDALKESSIFVPILSPVYIQRPYCMWELDQFAELIGAENPDLRERIFKVVKRKVERTEEPESLRGQEGYRFYAHNSENNREIVFYQPGSKNNEHHDKYWDTLRSLAANINATLKNLTTDAPQEEEIPEVKNGTVFLAFCSSDLTDQVRQVRGELEAAGVRVLPKDDDRPPLTQKELTDVLVEAFNEADVSVHLLGDSPGLVPEGATDPISLLQLQTAKLAGVKRIIWAPPSESRAAHMNDLVSDLGAGEGMTLQDELIEEGFDRLKGFLRSAVTNGPEDGEKVAPDKSVALAELLSDISPEDLLSFLQSKKG